MSKPIFHAALTNSDRIVIGVVTIPFPIPNEEYENCINLLTEAEMGDAARQDCYIDSIECGSWPALKALEGQYVNVDELDYLAKRLDSFCEGEDTQFQGMAHKLNLTNIRDLINLTFCCQQATVIDSFRELEKAGKDHLMNLNGGTMPLEDLQKADGKAVAEELIRSGGGQITPYGVVYDNGMELEQVYNGQNFPGYLYERYGLVLTATPREGLQEGETPVFLYLPSPQAQIDRALLRGGITSIEDAKIEVDMDELLESVSKVLTLEKAPLEDLNRMCAILARLDQGQLDKLDAVVECAEPSFPAQVVSLAENLELFDFAPHAGTPEELGEYLVKKSGHFEYDPNLEEFYDFKGMGEHWMRDHPGCFAEKGYISYEGAISLNELMLVDPLTEAQQEAEAQDAQDSSGSFQGQQMF